jgi:protein O-mannosyl-transferase
MPCQPDIPAHTSPPVDHASNRAGSLRGNRGVVLAVCGFLALAVALVFGQTVRHEFVYYDDQIYVYENPPVASGLTSAGFAWAFTHFHATNWHPVTWLSHMLDCQFFGLVRPGGHHLTNVVLHAASAILFFLLLLQMTAEIWPSALAATLFAIHPLHVESVAWVAERKDVLSGLFFMLTLAAYVGYARSPFSFFRYVLVLVLFALGLMAKPMLVTLPFVLLLLDYWPMGRWPRAGKSPVLLVLEKLPLMVLAAASCVVTYFAQSAARASIELIPLSSRFGNALISYVNYIAQFLYPRGLAVFYPFRKVTPSFWELVGAYLLLVGLTAGAFALRRRRPYLIVGWLWYLGMLVPVIGLMQAGAQSMADRYAYLPQIGLYLALVWGAMGRLQPSASGSGTDSPSTAFRAGWRPAPRWTCAVAALLLAVLTAAAWQQTSYWRDSETLWRHALACTQNNLLAHDSLGLILAGQGDVDGAINHYQEALKINPKCQEAHFHLGVVLARHGEVDAAIGHFQTALEIEPDYAEVHNNLGVVLAGRGEVDAAIGHFQAALKSCPTTPEANLNLGALLARRGEVDAAIDHFQAALESKPDYAEAHDNLGCMDLRKGRFDEAIAQFQAALQAKPDIAGTPQNLAMARLQRTKTIQALSERREAIRAQPDNILLLQETAWMLATNPNASVRDGQEAVELAERAVKLAGDNEPTLIGTLAAAYAEGGYFEKAAFTARKALDLAKRQGKPAQAEALQKMIRVYEAGIPFREPWPAGLQ